jgi:hypothetical protein
MKNTQLLASLAIVAGAVVSFGTAAHAGEGGAAGAVSLIMDAASGTNVITDLSAAAAVGKVNAAAASSTATSSTFASAQGSAGTLSMTNANTTGAGYTGGTDTALSSKQENELGVNKATISPTGVVTLP